MIVVADAQRLPLASGSVHAVVTSPPYWNLRTYDGERQARRWPDGWLGQLGLEPSRWLYLEHLRVVMREVWRVLRADGTLYLNLGDTYANDDKWGGETGGKQAYLPLADRTKPGRERTTTGMPRKSLLGLPWRLVLGLQEDGWLLRSEIIWAKTTPMPESVLDRPTRAHEHIFLLAKSPRYYYDWYGTMEPAAGTAHARCRGVHPKAVSASSRFLVARDPRSQTPGRIRCKQNQSFSAAVVGLAARRRLRSVWPIRAEAYAGAHYACFPRELARRCIAAATSEHGVCARCGVPWWRVVARSPAGDWSRDQALKSGGVNSNRRTAKAVAADGSAAGNLAASRQAHRAATGAHDRYFVEPRQAGWAANCRCDAGEPVPALMLDPFAGSGTVGEVARGMGRRAVLVDVGYQDLQRQRLAKVAQA